MVYRQQTALHLDGTSGLRGTGDVVNECLQPHPCAAIFGAIRTYALVQHAYTTYTYIRETNAN